MSHPSPNDNAQDLRWPHQNLCRRKPCLRSFDALPVWSLKWGDGGGYSPSCTRFHFMRFCIREVGCVSLLPPPHPPRRFTSISCSCRLVIPRRLAPAVMPFSCSVLCGLLDLDKRSRPTPTSYRSANHLQRVRYHCTNAIGWGGVCQKCPFSHLPCYSSVLYVTCVGSPMVIFAVGAVKYVGPPICWGMFVPPAYEPLCYYTICIVLCIVLSTADPALCDGWDRRSLGFQECVDRGQLHQRAHQECPVHHHQVWFCFPVCCLFTRLNMTAQSGPVLALVLPMGDQGQYCNICHGSLWSDTT